MGFRRIVDQQYEANNEKKMRVGRIVDQNSDKQDGCMVSIMLNSRLGMCG